MKRGHEGLSDLCLEWTIYGDGVWLRCSACEWEENLGFNASPLDAMLAACKHLKVDPLAAIATATPPEPAP